MGRDLKAVIAREVLTMCGLRSWLPMVVIAAVAALFSGCGGGGDTGSGVDHAGLPYYTPPANIAPSTVWQEWAVAQVRSGGGIADSLPTSLQGDATQLIGQYNGAGSTKINAAAGHFLGLGSTQTAKLPTALQAAMWTRGLMLRGGQIQTAAVQQLGPWTDEFGITWTGALDQSETTTSLSLHGLSASTDVTLTFTSSLQGLLAQQLGNVTADASYAMSGYIGDDIAFYDWENGQPDTAQTGRAVLDNRLTLHAQLNLVTQAVTWSGTLLQDISGQVQRDGSWVTTEREKTEGSYSGSISGATATLHTEVNATHGQEAGDGIFWAAMAADVDAVVDTTNGLQSLDGTLNVELSNKATMVIHVVESGAISGDFRDADDAILATFGGNLLTDGGIVHWQDGRPDESLFSFIS